MYLYVCSCQCQNVGAGVSSSRAIHELFAGDSLPLVGEWKELPRKEPAHGLTYVTLYVSPLFVLFSPI